MGKVSVKTGLNLLHIVWPEFVEVKDCIVRKDDAQAFGNETMDSNDREASTNHQPFSRDIFQDYTGFEASTSHQHVLDLFQHKAYKQAGDTENFYIPAHPDFVAACEFGKTLARIWFLKLQQDFPHYRFRVYYTEDDNPIVRFHRVREGEPFWLSEEDWKQDISDGKVVVLDSGC